MNPIQRLRAANHRRIEQRRAARRRQVPLPQLPFAVLQLEIDAIIAADAIRFESHAEPDITVLIACYGKLDMSLRCLASLYRIQSAAKLEVLVVEDASGDPAMRALDRIEGLRYVENPENLGFLKSCNHAAKRARGRHLLLLNNDTLLHRDAVDALYRVIEADAAVGLVGSKLVYPDGALQEAGGAIWRDGSGANIGKGQDPQHHRYDYLREVDYVSGASILVRGSVWKALGGFDERYAPAYYEDTDLAFRIREQGLKVVYQPKSTVVHLEGVSNGTDIQTGIKRYQAINRHQFVARWKDTLEKLHSPDARTAALDRRERWARGKCILVIDQYVPETDRDAGSRLMFALLKTLVGLGWTVKFWPMDLARNAYTRALQDLGIEVVYAPYTLRFGHWLTKQCPPPDAVIVSRPAVAETFLPLLKKLTSAPLYYLGHDLHFARMRLEQGFDPRKLARPQEALAMQQLEQDIWRQANVVLYPSQDEADTVRELLPGTDARVLQPYAFESFQHSKVPAAGQDILFVAGFKHTPNVDAAVWLVQEVMPLLRGKHPACRLLLVGSKPSEKVLALAGPAVRVSGNVSDRELSAHYRSARVAVVPLRFGAGVKLKVVEAMQQGLPLVTTPVGAQGLPGLDGIARVEQEPAAFADAVSLLLGDDAAWLAQSERQSAYVQAAFNTARLAESVTQIFGRA